MGKNTKLSLAVALSVATLGLASSTSLAASVGYHYVNGAFGAGSVLGAGETAGAPGFAQAGWNNHSGSGQGAPPVETFPFALTDDTGAATGMSVTSFTLGAANSWSNQDYDTADAKLLTDFANQDPIISITGVAAYAPSGYTAVLYYSNNEYFASAGTTLTVNGVSESIKTIAKFSESGYVKDVVGGDGGSNYAVFEGLSGNTLNIAFDSTQNDGFSALQIIPTPAPEPTSLGALAVVGSTLLLKRRRKA